MSPAVIALGILIVVLAGRYLTSRRTPGALHPSRVYSVLFTVHLGVPAILLGMDLAPSFVTAQNSDYLISALLFSVICLVAAAGGARLGTRIASKSASNVSDVYWKPRRVAVVVGLLVFASWSMKYLVVSSDAYFQLKRAAQGELQGPYYAMIRMVEQFSLFAIVVLNVYRWRVRGGDRKWVGRAAVILTLLEFLYWLPSGRKEETILTLLLPVATKHLTTGYVPSRRAVATFGIALVLFFPLSHYYRLQLEVNLSDLRVTDVAALADLATRSASTAEAASTPAEVMFGRISLVEPVAASIRLITTSTWDLLLGQSYTEGMLGLVPRVLWPSKPDLSYGNEFGQAAGYLDWRDTATSISVTFVGESFLNFGWLGFVAMFGMGAGLGLLYSRAVGSSNRAMYCVIYLIALPTLLFFGGTFAIFFGGLMKQIPFFAFLCWCLRAKRN